MDCGRENGGILAGVLGVCPVALAMEADGQNDGRAGGRVCWKIRRRTSDDAELLCDPMVAQCHLCPFFRRVSFEESHPKECPLQTVPA